MNSSTSWEENLLGCLGALLLLVVLILFSAWITTIVWGFIVPTVFYSAVTADLVPASLTLVQALKLSLLFWALGITTAYSASSLSKSSLFSGDVVSTIAAVIIYIIIFAIVWAIMVAISGFFVWLMWTWVITDVFAGAVAAGLIPAALTYWHACLVAVLFGVLGLSQRRSSNSSSK